MRQKLSELYPLKWFRNRVKSKKGPHKSSIHLADIIFKRFQPKRVIDLGCGTMSFANRMSELGVKRVVGVDGSKFNKEFAGGAKYLAHNLAEPFPESRKFDLVTSWDVFEHLPESAEPVIAKTVRRLSSKWLIVSIDPSSWGRHHLNCKPTGHWRKLFEKAGFVFKKSLTKKLQKEILADSRITSHWYARNLSVFRRKR